jgi:tetratricopeptide (TPR) repeat protein
MERKVKTVMITIITLIIVAISIAAKPELTSDGLFLDAKYWFNKSQNETDPHKKIELLTTALKIAPTYVEALNNRANVYHEVGEFSLALFDYLKILKIDSSNIYAYRNRAILYQQTGKLDSALTDIKRLLEIDSTISDGYAIYAQIMGMRRQRNEALMAVNKSLALDSTNWRALEVRLKIMFQERNYGAVLEDVEKSLIFSPNKNDLLEMKAACLGKLKRYDEAISIDSILAIKYTVRNHYAYYNLACLYALKNDRLNALRYLEEAFRRGYNDFGHARIDTDFKSIRETNEFTDLITKYQSNGK